MNWFLMTVTVLYAGAGVVDIVRDRPLWGALWLLYAGANIVAILIHKGG